MPRPIEVVPTAKFARDLTADTTIYLDFIKMKLNVLNYAAHCTESHEVGIWDVYSERLLHDMDAFLPFLLMGPTYPMWQNYACFTTPLIDFAV